MKYKSLTDLKQAIDCGELVLEEGEVITIDNDATYLYVGKTYDKDEDDYTDGEKVFDGGTPYELLFEALALLGIPCEAT